MRKNKRGIGEQPVGNDCSSRSQTPEGNRELWLFNVSEDCGGAHALQVGLWSVIWTDFLVSHSNLLRLRSKEATFHSEDPT